MSDIVKAVVSFQGASGLPEDRFVNTFWFVVDDTTDPILTSVSERLVDFYNTLYVDNPIAGYLSSVINRGADDGTIDIYQTPGASLPPIFTWSFTPEAAASANDYASEVAVCLSFKNDSVTSVPQRNRRGRIFLGPLNTAAVNEVSNVVRPSTAITGDLAVAGATLKAADDADAVWVVYSRVLDQTFPVESGWIDNALDTQRRRGFSATTRTAWS